MNCYRHPSAPAAAECVACLEPICATCREDVAGHAMCRPCLLREESRLQMEGAAPAGATGSYYAGPAAAADPAGLRPADPLADLQAISIPGKAPGAARRVLRGLGWGIVFGQIWTALRLFWMLVWSGGGAADQLFVGFLIYGIYFGFFGALTGLVIGASNTQRGALLGSVVGVGIGLLETLIFQSPAMLINLFFFFFTGQWIGGLIMDRVQRPAPR